MKYKEVISTEGANWESEAEKLAQERNFFVVVAWDYTFHNEFCMQLAHRYGYRYRFDPKKGRAFFDLVPKDSSSE